jgi:hypothetical protein
MKNLNDLQKLIDDFNQSELGKKTNKNLNKVQAGIISSKKQWSENREELLKRSKKGGDKCMEEQKGIFNLCKEELSQQGKNGYSKGLSKLTKGEICDIASKAGKANREKNAKLKPEDVKYVRQVFIPYHPEFGVVPLSKKYGVSEGAMRGAIKGKSFKDIV